MPEDLTRKWPGTISTAVALRTLARHEADGAWSAWYADAAETVLDVQMGRRRHVGQQEMDFEELEVI